MRFFRRKLGQNQAEPVPLVTFTYLKHVQAIEKIADGLPWLGEKPFQASKSRHVPRPAIDDDRFVRRVLISWLIGRPVSQVAKRVGCSPRLVLEIVRKAIYRVEWIGHDELMYWCGLGLLSPVDGPEFVGELDDSFEPWSMIVPEHMPIVCLVCHRFVGMLEIGRRRFDGSVVGPDDPRLQEGYVFQGLNRPGSIHDIESHLIMHFQLDLDPINVFRSKRVLWPEELGLEIGTITGKRARSVRARRSLGKRLTWDNDIPQETLAYFDAHSNDPSYTISPRKGSRTLTDEQAERIWKRILGRIER